MGGSLGKNSRSEKYGYHVLKVQSNSPAQLAKLEPYFDFIISFNGISLNEYNFSLITEVEKNVDIPIVLKIYNTKTQEFRDVQVIPNNNWGGQGFLGISIRFCTYMSTIDNVWHILEVQPDSPAYFAGLQSYTDYIIGSDILISDNEDLFELIKLQDGCPIKLFVYSNVTKKCREVNVTPNSHWEGEGLLGCSIGYGYLHRIPGNVKSILQNESSLPIRENILSHEEPIKSNISSNVV